jgi:hypothetical protein
MQDPARHQPPGDGTGTSTEALSRALARHREALTAKLGLIEAERAAGHLTPVQASEQAHAARAVYDRDVALAEIAADTGWETWAGVGGVLYARIPQTQPAAVVRAPSPQALREAIERYE